GPQLTPNLAGQQVSGSGLPGARSDPECRRGWSSKFLLGQLRPQPLRGSVDAGPRRAGRDSELAPDLIERQVEVEVQVKDRPVLGGGSADRCADVQGLGGWVLRPEARLVGQRIAAVQPPTPG